MKKRGVLFAPLSSKMRDEGRIASNNKMGKNEKC